LLEKLRPLGRLRAVTISGVVWPLWHAPLAIIPNRYYGAELALLGTVTALLIFVLLGFIFGWLYV